MTRTSREKPTISAHRLPMALAAPGPRPPHAPARPDAAFIAQLLAARENLSLQRARRRASDGEANRAYRRAETSDVKRLPQGYRRMVSV